MSPCIVKAWVGSYKHFMSHTLIIHSEQCYDIGLPIGTDYWVLNNLPIIQ